MPKSHSKRDLSGPFAHELYIHRAVEKGLARVFFREYEQSQSQKVAAGRRVAVAFRFADVVYFFAVAAASGVVGNLAYDALATVVRAIRKPKQEFPSGVTFEVVISRRTYNRLHRQKHPGTKGISRAISQIEKALEVEYRLMVTRERADR
jgi:hypothetical protein